MGKHLLYINLDGFGKYYYDQMADRDALKGINRLKRMGCFFEQARTGIPSITYPMQSAIVSGCYSEMTGNCDKIWIVIRIRWFRSGDSIKRKLSERF